jgi:hypothetical protein
MRKSTRLIKGFLVLASLLIVAAAYPAAMMQADNPNPPDPVVKLIFIHHSTGENWLADGYGDLGRVLGQNNYFVSDTNYGWGPDGIGDRTDIPDWIEWFRSENTPTYMQALFNENGQNAGYSRSLPDPGGENQVILFKSCFPNSALEGNPDDPPGTYEDLTVGGAKYVYNQLLGYFASRPDKLFVVITAPPLSDDEYADNARAFNQWLVGEWLSENQYTLNNVAVFDFYNVLTDPDSHHRFIDGRIEHTIGGGNTLHYPSGDDHPSEQGSQKATEEFVPLLNVFYHRWQAETPSQPPVSEPLPPEPDEEVETQPVAPPLAAGMIDDFEAGQPAGTNGWEPFWDASTPSSMNCQADPNTSHSGSRALLLDFDIAPESWGTCALFYDNAQNWSGSPGISFSLHAAQSGLTLDVDLYVGGPDERESYITRIETTPNSVDGWVPVDLTWDQFKRVDWEADAGTPFGKADQVSGMAFGLSADTDAPNQGTIWVDDLQLLGSQPAAEVPEPVEPPPDTAAEPEEAPTDEPGTSLPCIGALALPLGLVGLYYYRQRKNEP